MIGILLIKMKIIVHILAVLLIVSASAEESIPVMPNQYEVTFNQTLKIFSSVEKTKGTMHFDYTNNRSLVTRQDGSHDKVCRTIEKFGKTPCNHYVVQGKRFIDFPAKKYCCYCCDVSHGCGVLKPNWMVIKNASYDGLELLPPDDQPSLKWVIHGDADNYYYHKNDEMKTPRRLFQLPDDLMDFTSFNLGIKDPSVFALPKYCTEKCGKITACQILREDQGESSKILEDFGRIMLS